MKHSLFTRLFLLCLILPLAGLSFRTVQAQDEADVPFSEFIKQLKTDGIIPNTDGTITSYGSYEKNIAKFGYWEGIPLLEADHFVISAKFKMNASTKSTDVMNAGCGFFFDTLSGGSQYMMVSARMDGNAYLQGYRNYTKLSYGNYLYGSASTDQEGSMTLVFNGSRATFYINGRNILSRGDLPVIGNSVGLSILSGTNYDFGTGCSFDEINVYTWEDPAE